MVSINLDSSSAQIQSSEHAAYTISFPIFDTLVYFCLAVFHAILDANIHIAYISGVTAGYFQWVCYKCFTNITSCVSI